jgi:predicted MFS family arabinose efflux permease
MAERYGWRIAVLTVTIIGAFATAAFFVATPTPRGFRRSAGAPMPVWEAVVANLRRREMVVLFVQAMLLMGGFVAVYNYLTFHLEAAPFGLTPTRIALLFFAYLAGTLSSGWAGRLAGRHGRIRTLCGSIAIMVAGAVLMLAPLLATFVVGLVAFTAGFFGAHAIASGWVGYRATAGKSQAASLYNLFYYFGSSFFGWFCGLVFSAAGWGGMIAMVTAMALLAAALGVMQWRARPDES